MGSRFSGRCCVGVTIALFALVPACGETPLSQVPAPSPVVVQVRGHERTMGRVKKTLEASLGDLAAMVTGQLESGIAELVAGRELKALAPEGPIFIVFTAITEDEENLELAVVAKVTNYVQFRDGLLTDAERKKLTANKAGYEDTTINDKPAFFLSKGDYAVFSMNEKAMKHFTDKKAPSLDGKLAGALQQKFLEHDLSVYVDAEQLNKQFGDKIADAKQMLDQVFQQFEMTPGLGKQMASVKKLYGGLFQLVEDSEQFVAGISFDPDGMRIQAHTTVGEKSASNKLFAESPTVKFESLGALPAGQLNYTSSAGGLEILKLMGGGMMGVGTPNLADDKENKAYAAVLAELTNLKVEGWLGAMDYPQQGIQAVRYPDNAKAADLSLKLFESVKSDASFGGVPIKNKPEVKRDAEKFRGFAFHHVQFTWDFAKLLESFPEEIRDAMKGSFQKSLGDQMKIWFGSDGKQFIQVHAKDWPAASKMVATFLDGKGILAQDAAFIEQSKKLPPQGSMLMLLNAGKFALAIAQSAGGALLGQPNAPPAAEPKLPEGPASYIGIVAAAQSRNGMLDAWVPAKAVKVIVDVLKPLFSGIGDP